MKKVLFLLFLALTLPLFAWEVSLNPSRPRAGQWGLLVFRTDKGEELPDPGRELPDVPGLTFARNNISQSTQIRIINGRRSHIVEKSIPFLAEKEGSYTIPLKRLSKWNSSTRESLSFRVLPSSAPAVNSNEGRRGREEKGSLSWEEALFFRIEVPEKKKEYFPGEEINVDFSLYIVRGLRAQIASYPAVTFGSSGKSMAIFRDYRKVNNENPDYEGVYRSVKEVNGRKYDVYSFRTAILPSLAGNLSISAKVNTLVTLPDERRDQRRRGSFWDDDDDPFFSSFFSRDRRVTRVVKAPEIALAVSPLPAVEKGAFSTDLVGNYTFSAVLSPVKGWKTGEVGNLTLTVSGSGNMDFLKAPSLDLPGFRVYPPEIKKSPGKAEIAYVLIPLEVYQGKHPNLILPPLAYFDPVKGKYQYFRWQERMTIEKGPLASAASSSPVKALPLPRTAPENGESRKAEEKPNDELLYLKEWKGESNLGNTLLQSILLGLAGLLFPIFALIYRRYRGKTADPRLLRKKEASRNKKDLFRTLEKIPLSELSSLAPRIATQLSDTFSLAPGCDLKEAAGFVKGRDRKLGEDLERIAESSFMPGFASFTEEFRRDLLKRLKKLLPLLLFAFFFTFAGEAMGKSPSLIQEGAEAAKAYDSGDFARSAALYTRLLEKVKNDPVLYYNCGNAYARMGDDPRALACYERALRLSPREKSLRHNLALVRKRLMLPSLDRSPENPLEVMQIIRDQFLPEEWGLFLAFGIFILGLSAGMGILFSSGDWFKWGGAAGGLILLVSLAAILTLLPARYSGREGIVTGEKPLVYTLPSLQASLSKSFFLKKGELIEIKEKRRDWARIRLGSHEGWIPLKDMTALWDGK